MISTDSVNDSVLGPPVGAIELRIRGGSRDGHRMRLPSSKCTLGASDSCSLQFRQPGVHPIHCLILRGRGGAVIRRWSPDTRLNGKLFDDAVLKNGDQLTLGPVEFEVSIEAEVQPPSVPASPASVAVPVPPPSERDALRDEFEERLRGMQQQLSDSRRASHQRSRRLIGSVRDARKREKELVERETKAQEREQRLDQREEAIDCRKRAAQESDQILQDRTNQFNIDVERYREEQKEENKQREQQRDQHQLDLRKIEEQRLALQQDRASLETDRLEFQENRSKEEANTEEKEVRFDSTSPEPPMNSADLFARVGMEMPQEATPETGFPSEELSNGPSSPPGGNTSATEEDDESIEDYMARLMVRVRGEVEEAEAEAGIAVPRPVASHSGPMPSNPSTDTQIQAESRIDEMSDKAVPGEQASEPDASFPHKSAPEKASNLAAMRDIANASARSHIAQSTKEHWGQVALGKLAMALIALVAGIALTLWSTHLPSLPFLGACFGYLAAGYWMLQSALLAKNMLKAGPSDNGTVG